MNKRHLIIFVCLIVTGSIYSQEQEVAAPEQAQKPEQVEAPVAVQPEIAPKPKPSTLNSFSRFVRIFVALLRNQQIKNNLQIIEKLFASLLQTANQVIQTTKPTTIKQTRSEQDASDTALIAQLAHTVITQSESLSINRLNHHSGHPKVDAQTQEILANFSMVVQNFFNILRDPENPETVPANIIGMLAGMVNIGVVAATKGNIPIDAEYEQLKAYAGSLDTEMKEHMCRIIFTAQERCGITLN